MTDETQEETPAATQTTTPDVTNETPKEKGGKWRATLLQELSSSQAKILAMESRLARLETPETTPETTQGTSQPKPADGKSSPHQSSNQNEQHQQTSETPETPTPTPKRKLIFGPSTRRKKS